MRNPILMTLLALTIACAPVERHGKTLHTRYADFFDIIDTGRVVTFSPYTGEADTLVLDGPLRSVVCMSTTHVAYLDALGCDSLISAVSGLEYVSSPLLSSRSDVLDIGYEAELDYESLIALKPDLLLAYSASSLIPQYVNKLRSLGFKVLMLSDHLEDHPLARAEYIRLFGALTGTMDIADSSFMAIEDRYLTIASESDTLNRTKVLFNMPYNDQWFIPGEYSYMSRLVHDAGGITLGADPGSRNSGIISLEKAYILSKEADVWLNPGTCSTMDQIRSSNLLPVNFAIPKIYNNTLRMNSKGGNDFWESGAVRPDLVLEDLVRIFRGEKGSFNYYLEID